MSITQAVPAIIILLLLTRNTFQIYDPSDEQPRKPIRNSPGIKTVLVHHNYSKVYSNSRTNEELISGNSQTEHRPFPVYRPQLNGSIASEQHPILVLKKKKRTPKSYNECPEGESGQFVYELSCNQFLNCWNGRGFVQNCAPGTLFNPKSLECDHMHKVECITGPRQSAGFLEKHARNVEQVRCPKEFSGLIPNYKDCSKFINCNNGIEISMDCPPGTLFDTNSNMCDHANKAVCFNGENEQRNGRLVEEKHYGGTQRASTIHQQGLSGSGVAQCPPGYSGLMEHPSDCSKFLNCANGQTFVQDCAPGTLFNHNSKNCDFPYNVQCVSQTGSDQTIGHSYGTRQDKSYVIQGNYDQEQSNKGCGGQNQGYQSNHLGQGCGQPGQNQGNRQSSGQHGQTGQFGQSNQHSQTGQYGQTSQHGQSGQYGQTSQHSQTGQYGQTGQHGQSGQYGQTSQHSQTGQYGQTSQYGQSGQYGENDQYGQTSQNCGPRGCTRATPRPTEQYGLDSGQFEQSQTQGRDQYGQNHDCGQGGCSSGTTNVQYGQTNQHGQTGQYGQTNQYHQTGQTNQNCGPRGCTRATPRPSGQYGLNSGQFEQSQTQGQYGQNQDCGHGGCTSGTTPGRQHGSSYEPGPIGQRPTNCKPNQEGCSNPGSSYGQGYEQNQGQGLYDHSQTNQLGHGMHLSQNGYDLRGDRRNTPVVPTRPEDCSQGGCHQPEQGSLDQSYDQSSNVPSWNRNPGRLNHGSSSYDQSYGSPSTSQTGCNNRGCQKGAGQGQNIDQTSQEPNWSVRPTGQNFEQSGRYPTGQNQGYGSQAPDCDQNGASSGCQKVTRLDQGYDQSTDLEPNWNGHSGPGRQNVNQGYKPSQPVIVTTYPNGYRPNQGTRYPSSYDQQSTTPPNSFDQQNVNQGSRYPSSYDQNHQAHYIKGYGPKHNYDQVININSYGSTERSTYLKPTPSYHTVADYDDTIGVGVGFKHPSATPRPSRTPDTKSWPPPFPSTDVNADYVFEYEDGEEVTLEAENSLKTDDFWNRKRGICQKKDYHCTGAYCVPKTAVCDGKQDCANGKDEEGCYEKLKKFEVHSNSKLAVLEQERWDNVSVSTCAALCLDTHKFRCKSFNYRKVDRTCFLTNTNIGLTGALISYYPCDYHELISEKMDCTGLYQCENKKCIGRAQICDGHDDCGDRMDEKGCKPQDFGYSLRLTGSKHKHEGQIEVTAFGKTGFICDDKFGLRDAHVVCRELGFVLGAAEVKSNSYYAKNASANPFYMMDDVSCLGNETCLMDCDFGGWGVHNCVGQEIVGVVCKTPLEKCPKDYWQCDSGNECLPLAFICDGLLDCTDESDENAYHCDAPMELRLANGSNSQEGRVEVKHHGTWGTVCDDDFNEDAAKVVCSSLGFRGSASVKKNGFFGPGTGPIWLDQVFCSGNESSLETCTHWNWGENNCEHSEDVGVICSQYTERHATDTRPPPQKKPRLNIPSEYPEQCGFTKDNLMFNKNDEVHFRVVKGTVARRGDYPWQAAIRVKGKSKAAHWCGAVIISEKFVLTAAHCLIGYSKGAYIIVAGDYNVDEDEGTEQEAFIEDYYIHEDFRKGHKMNNDIALIKLKGRGFILNQDVQPICLAKADADYEHGNNCTISGYGSIQSGKSAFSHDMRAGWVPLQSRYVCKMPHVYGAALTDGMICAGSLDEGVDSCDGDSGGPLACLDEGAFTLYGITSWGQHCGYANKPGVYVKVAHYRKWIDDNFRKYADDD